MTKEDVLYFEDAGISVWGDAINLASPDAAPENLVVLSRRALALTVTIQLLHAAALQIWLYNFARECVFRSV